MNWLKNKAVIVILSCILLATGIGVYMLLRDRIVLEIKEKAVIFEYGDKVELTANDVLKNTDKEVLASTKIESTLENEKDKEYPKLGKYQAIVSYKKEKITIDIEIKDTKAPVFNSCNSVEFVKGTDFNYGQYVLATDLQVVTYVWQKDTIDINTVGEYTLSVLAIDASNNETTKDIKVHVLEAVDTTNNEVITSVDDSGNVKTIITQKPRVEDENDKTSINQKTPSSKPNIVNPSVPNPTTPTPDVTPKPEEDHQHYSSFISPLFDTNEEREQWGDNYLYSQSVPWEYEGYVTSTCSCGKKGITSFY